MNKFIKTGALVILGAIGLLLFILYATVKTKSTGLNSYEPFKALIGKTLVLNKETQLFIDQVTLVRDAEFPYMLMDDLHPDWAYYQECKDLPQVKIEEVLSLPKGTEFHVQKAVQYTTGVAGSSHPTLYGSIQYRGKTYQVAYRWGQRDSNKAYSKTDKYWKFHQAPWQDKPDTASYALPIAKVW